MWETMLQSVISHHGTTKLKLPSWTNTVKVINNHLGIELCKIILSRQGTGLWSYPCWQTPCLQHCWARGYLTPSWTNFIQNCEQIWNCVMLAQSAKPKVTWNKNYGKIQCRNNLLEINTNTHEFIQYTKENTTHLHYENQLVDTA